MAMADVVPHIIFLNVFHVALINLAKKPLCSIKYLVDICEAKVGKNYGVLSVH
jgi:hypothetical protein